MKDLQDVIYRIQKMEQSFDEVLEALKCNSNIVKEDGEVFEKLQELTEYYESGLWLQDYECDERGELPADLKRGVLSEDGLYNLLTEIENQDLL